MDSGDDKPFIGDTAPKRVKAYVLENNEWKDTGTGFCVGRLEKNGNENDDESKVGAFLIVNNEEAPEEVLLRSKLEGNIEYQRQEETLIVWKDLSGHDIALSFEESVGCDVLCEFVVQVQRKLEHNISLVAVKSTDNGVGSIHEIITGPVTLPSKDWNQDSKSLLEALKILNENVAFEFLKNETIEFVLKTNYLGILIKRFHEAETQKLPEDLLLLGCIVKTLVLYNQRDILEQMADDDKIMGIVGILEYDTEYPTSKANHRKCLDSYGPRFKEVIPIENSDLKNIIKKCFRLQFLKDVVLVRFLEDHNFNLILEIILDLETCIVDFLQVDPFLDRLMGLYDDNNEFKGEFTESEMMKKRKDGIKLLHQCVQMSKGLDPVDKSKFYKNLVRKPLFKVLDYAFRVETDDAVRILATDTIITIIEHDILLIHNVQHETKQYDTKLLSKQKDGKPTTKDMSLLLILSTILLTDKSPGLKEQVAQALHTLLHPEGCFGIENEFQDSPPRNGRNGTDFGSLFNYNLEMSPSPDELEEKNAAYLNDSTETNPDILMIEYFNNFYNEVAPVLFAPLVRKNGKAPAKEVQGRDNNSLIHLVKFVTFIATEHDRRLSRRFILENGLLDSVSELVEPSSYSLQLRLTAVRCFKNIMSLDDDYYYRYMISKELFKPIFGLLEENLYEDNLANSCIQDFFKIIASNCLDVREEIGLTTDPCVVFKTTNFTLLKTHLIEKYGSILEKAKYIKFVNDLLRYHREQTVPGEDSAKIQPESRVEATDESTDEATKSMKRRHSELDPHGSEDLNTPTEEKSVTFKRALEKFNRVESTSSSPIIGEILRE